MVIPTENFDCKVKYFRKSGKLHTKSQPVKR